MNIKYFKRDGKVLAVARINNKIFVNINTDEVSAHDGLLDKIKFPIFALYDMDAPTSHHNSSVRTRA
jgi:hypothetical protein